MELRLRTLTPFHIGTGEQLSPLEYVVDGNRYYRLEEQVFTEFLRKQDPKTSREFGSWIRERYLELSRFREEYDQLPKQEQRRDRRDFNQRYSALRDAATPLDFCREKQLDRHLFQFLKKHPRVVAARVRARDIVKSQVNVLQKDGLGRAYLPGSSIKGAVRTALLYNWLQNTADPQEIIRLIQERLRGRPPRDTQMDDTLEELVFYCRAEVRGKKLVGHEYYDLMKLVQLTDAHLTEERDSLELADVKAYVTKREKVARDKFAYVADEQRQPPFVEAVRAERELAGELHFNIEFLYAVHAEFVGHSAIRVGRETHWKELPAKVKALFGLDMEDLKPLRTLSVSEREARLDELRDGVHRHIIDCVSRFSRRQLEADENWLGNFAVADTRRDYIDQMEAGWAEILARRELSLLHLGYGAGFTSTTVLLYFLEERQLREAFESIMKEYGIGLPGNKQRDRDARAKFVPHAGKFPKSKRLIKGEDRIVPLGWFLIGEDIAPEALAEATAAVGPPAPEPEYYTGNINYKRPPIVDAVVTKSGKPNYVKIYLSPDNSPELKLDAYRSAIEEGTVIQVQIQISKKSKVLSAAFRAMKSI